MTTHPDHHELLDAEERDLAARLGRVGPFDGPSPALDAKILAAAHAAAATRTPSRPRRLAWLGVPPALVTGVGVAAAAVLALGLVWQMRPHYGETATQSEASAAGEEEVILVAPMGAAKAPPANPPPFPQPPEAAAPSERATAAARMQDSAPARASADVARAAAEPSAAPAASAEAGVLAAQARAESSAEEKSVADAAAVSANDGFVAEPAGAAAPIRKSHATYTSSARAKAEQRGYASNSAPAAPPAAAVPAPAVAAPAAEASESDARTLDRIEVTGSRLRRSAVAWAEVPIHSDSQLVVAEWLQRIRDRRDDGDLEHAKASLALFRREHPRVRLPADLRALLTDAKQ